MAMAIISLAPVQFWSDFQMPALSRGRMPLRLCASRHRQSLSLRFGIRVFLARFLDILQLPKSWPETSLTWKATIYSVCHSDSRTLPAQPAFTFRPSVLIVAGDAADNGVHLHLSESTDQQKRQEWIAALDKMESLKPRAVIAGHKRLGNDDSPRILGETRQYIRDFERLAMQTTTAV